MGLIKVDDEAAKLWDDTTVRTTILTDQDTLTGLRHMARDVGNVNVGALVTVITRFVMSIEKLSLNEDAINQINYSWDKFMVDVKRPEKRGRRKDVKN